MKKDYKQEYQVLLELEGKAKADYCVSKVIAQYMPTQSLKECVECKYPHKCRSYDNFGELPIDIFGDIYHLCCDIKTGKWNPDKRSKLEDIADYEPRPLHLERDTK
jgi:hypothetical protein